MIVLHTTKYGESSLIVHVYSPEHGRTGLLLRGAARSRSSRNNLRLLHPLNILDVTLVSGRRQSDLLPVKEFNQHEPLTNLRTDLRKSSICLFLGELLYRTLRESSPDPELYRFLTYAIRLLDSLQESPCSNFHLWFLVGFASHLGFRPQNDRTEQRSAFNIPGARFETPPVRTDEHWFSPSCSQLLMEMMQENTEKTLLRPLNSEKRNDFCRCMLRYLRFHLDLDFDIKSLDILHQVLHT